MHGRSFRRALSQNIADGVRQARVQGGTARVSTLKFKGRCKPSDADISARCVRRPGPGLRWRRLSEDEPDTDAVGIRTTAPPRRPSQTPASVPNSPKSPLTLRAHPSAVESDRLSSQPQGAQFTVGRQPTLSIRYSTYCTSSSYHSYRMMMSK